MSQAGPLTSGGGGGGSVTSVNGTVNQIDVSPTTGNVYVSIDSNYSPITWPAPATTTPIITAANHGYIANKASQIVFNLPTTGCIVGSQIIIGGNIGGGTWKVAIGGGQSVYWANTVATSSLTSAGQYQTVTLTCIVANTIWAATSASGSITAV